MTTHERWRVGDVTVTKVYETTLDHETFTSALHAPPDGLDAHRDWMGPYLGPNDELLMSVHAFCVEADGLRIVVDTCIGNDLDYGPPPYPQFFNHLHTTFLDDLTAVGFGRDDVDVVVCTHLHPDHVGWNTLRTAEGRWEPTFRRARYVLTDAEAAVWRTRGGAFNPWPFAIQPVLDAGRLDLVPATHRISESVRLVPTPGHTAGHVAVRIHSAGADAIITGDMVHSPVQLVEPDWTYVHDTDPARAAAGVRALLDEVRDTDTLVLGTHFPSPTAGRIVTTPAGVRFR